ncbi:HPr family phosphocarrier protein [Neptunicella sp. SCSIO 80796]|uniref:HPr family phosphocarrier protein n=1 Tax=Neptunicella plasticusilytica TaxID=3117012 RepID=UPI003A4DAC55
MNRIEKSLVIQNKLGLHARAATQLAKLANQFDAQVTIQQQDKSASANSVLGLMMLESHQGKEITVISEGVDAIAAMDAVEELVAKKFNEAE